MQRVETSNSLRSKAWSKWKNPKLDTAPAIKAGRPLLRVGRKLSGPAVGVNGECPHGAQGCSRVRAGANIEGAGMDENQRAERANRYLNAMVSAFNKVTEGKLPILKKQTAESMTKDWSEAMKQSFMSRVDLS